MNYAIILAGGTGSRFWPLSRQLEPKQLLSIYSNKTMLEETIERISPSIKKKNIYIATNMMHRQKIRKAVKHLKIPIQNILLEPEGKNTLAPIAVLSKRIYASDKNAIIAALPSDHLVINKEKFLRLLAKGFNIAKGDVIVTFGVSPERPETGYGYIKISSKLQAQSSKLKKLEVYKVDRFIEKPPILKATN